MATVADIAEEVAIKLGADYSNDPDIASDYDQHCIDVIEDLYYAAPYWWRSGIETVSVTGGQRTTSFPATAFDITSAVWDGDHELEEVSLLYIFETMEDITEESSLPEYIYPEGSQDGSKSFGLYPVPSSGANVTALVLYDIPALTSSTDIPLPTSFNRAIKLGIEGIVRSIDDQENFFKMNETLYNRAKERLVERESTSRLAHIQVGRRQKTAKRTRKTKLV